MFLPNLTKLPPIRQMYIPDPGFILCRSDLDRADAQVVAWEADDQELKTIFREGLDMHLANARIAFQLDFTLNDLRDPLRLKEIAKAFAYERQLAKGIVHATNYGSTAHGLALNFGLSQSAAAHFQEVWFSEHPGIRAWHDRIMLQLQTTRMVTNAFGFSRRYLDRIDRLLPEALAWIPQSTVARIINEGISNIDEDRRLWGIVENLLQVHDEAIYQIKNDSFEEVKPIVHEHLLIEVPYPDPLVIPIGLKVSTRSWHDAEETPWEKAA